jgi:hypothetical protein
MPALTLPVNTLTQQFAQGLAYDLPQDEPLQLIQQTLMQVAVYFVQSTGSPLSPFTYTDPSDFVNIKIAISNLVEQTAYLAYSDVYSIETDINNNKYALFSFSLETQSLINFANGARGVKATLEVQWDDGDNTLKSQNDCYIATNVINTGGLAPTPVAQYLTRSEGDALYISNVGFPDYLSGYQLLTYNSTSSQSFTPAANQVIIPLNVQMASGGGAYTGTLRLKTPPGGNAIALIKILWPNSANPTFEVVDDSTSSVIYSFTDANIGQSYTGSLMAYYDGSQWQQFTSS